MKTREGFSKRCSKGKEAHVLLYSANPKVGKLSNPHESPMPLKNHLKKLQMKLMLRYFPRLLTCFLRKVDERNVQNEDFCR